MVWESWVGRRNEQGGRETTEEYMGSIEVIGAMEEELAGLRQVVAERAWR